jgi:plasmid maintenance system antidote protein VapI
MTDESLANYLRRNLLGRGGTPNEIAQRLGVTRPALDTLLNGGGLSIPMALKLEAVFGLPARDLLIQQLDRQIAAERERSAPMRP